MKKSTVFFGALALSVVLVSCAKVPVTGRRQLSLVSDETINKSAVTAYQDFLKEPKTKVIANTADAERVKTVGKKIATVIDAYLKEKYPNAAQNYQWEFNLVESKEINAWCMPGGKVAVYTGILPITKDDVGLATVMGHEISHAIARHSAERYSQTLAAQAGGNILGAITGNQSQTTQQAIGKLYGIGGSLALLKYSRNQESEADHLGLLFMAMAGYNPEKAVDFWERMATSKGANGAPPEFLSTHPSDATRIADIKKSLPEALRYYQAAKR
jgi:predicted Zn-dependent protease